MVSHIHHTVIHLFYFQHDIPTREEQFDFFTNTYDDLEEEQEKRASVMRAGIKELQRRPSTIQASTSTGPETSAEAKVYNLNVRFLTDQC